MITYTYFFRRLSSCVQTKNSPHFETIFSFPTIKYFSLINRLKLYQFAGTAIAIPSSGILEMASLASEHTFLSTCYMGVTAAAVLSIFTLPFRNVIGFLYVSDDNKLIKISSVDFWGKRTDKIIKVDDWIPLLNMDQKITDTFYLSPQLIDGTKYKLFVKFGKVLDSKKFGQILE